MSEEERKPKYECSVNDGTPHSPAPLLAGRYKGLLCRAHFEKLKDKLGMWGIVKDNAVQYNPSKSVLGVYEGL